MSFSTNEGVGIKTSKRLREQRQWKLLEKRGHKYLYVFKSEDGTLKIGISQDPAMRAQGVTSQMKKEFFIYYLKLFPRYEAGTRERIAHARLKEFAIGNELFSCSLEHAVSVINDITEKDLQKDKKPDRSLGKHIKRVQMTIRMDEDLAIKLRSWADGQMGGMSHMLNIALRCFASMPDEDWARLEKISGEYFWDRNKKMPAIINRAVRRELERLDRPARKRGELEQLNLIEP